MQKKEQLVKIVTTDDKGRRHIRWERQMVEENPVQVPETPLGIITLPLGKVYISGKETYGVRPCKVKEKVFSGDKLITKSKSRLVMKVIDLFGGGEFRMGQESEIIVSEESLKVGSQKGGITQKQQKEHTMWGTYKGLTTRSAPSKKPTAVAAIRG